MAARKRKPSTPKRKAGGAPKGNKNALGNPGGTGRPQIYSPDLIPKVKALALYGMSDEEIADFIEVSVHTLRHWRQQHVEFKAGTYVSDDEMAEAARSSLFKRAMGFTFKSEKIMVAGGEIQRVKTTEYVPPDVNAAFKILQAYDKKQAFREKTEVTSTFSLADLVALSMEQRARKAQQAKLIETRPNEDEETE